MFENASLHLTSIYAPKVVLCQQLRLSTPRRLACFVTYINHPMILSGIFGEFFIQKQEPQLVLLLSNTSVQIFPRLGKTLMLSALRTSRLLEIV